LELTPPHFPGGYGTFKKGEMLEALSKPTGRRIVMMAEKKNCQKKSVNFRGKY
jgi:hypothetical protein